MPRTLGDIPFGKGLPPKGKHNCTVLNAIKGFSSTKKTPQIEIILSNGETEFSDQLYVTEKTLPRLCLVAQRVCGMSKETVIPDSNKEAIIFLASFIMENIVGKNCVVTIEENEEIYIPSNGPDMGRSIKRMRKRVSFNGYDVSVEAKEQRQPGEESIELPITQQEEELPF